MPDVDEEIINEENNDESLPFARARVYRILKENVGEKKIIRSSVKEQANIWLGNLLAKIARKMGESKYSTIELADFQAITEPYDRIEELDKERERLIKHLQAIKADCDAMIEDIERNFHYKKRE